MKALVKAAGGVRAMAIAMFNRSIDLCWGSNTFCNRP